MGLAAAQQELSKAPTNSKDEVKPQKEKARQNQAELEQLIKDLDLPSITEAIEALVGHPEVCFSLMQSSWGEGDHLKWPDSDSAILRSIASAKAFSKQWSLHRPTYEVICQASPLCNILIFSEYLFMTVTGVLPLKAQLSRMISKARWHDYHNVAGSGAEEVEVLPWLFDKHWRCPETSHQRKAACLLCSTADWPSQHLSGQALCCILSSLKPIEKVATPLREYDPIISLAPDVSFAGQT